MLGLPFVETEQKDQIGLVESRFVRALTRDWADYLVNRYSERKAEDCGLNGSAHIAAARAR